ncbi:uncharacterized protein LOC110991226 [Acanthaster planci]|uniref:Uncharacterized protein LOC110991226 n=1 Tax=Acanthaster planci TaxID=133434 RepID=A0A8B8A3C2_ACAPL|nr:uncharacterized protein LOC110991226 [Acanthaster planci]
MAAIRIQASQKRPPPTPEPMDAVYDANVVVNTIGDGHWRPQSSISQNALTTDTSEPENPDNDQGGQAVVLLKNKSRVSIIDGDTAPRHEGAEGSLRIHGIVPRDPPPTRAASTVSHKTNGVKRRFRLRTAPGKLQRTAELDRAFSTMNDRTRVTIESIRGNTRTSRNEFGDRVCRPYSVYTVTKQCERLAISPFGGPLLNSAAGRYRERFLSKHRPDVVQGTSRGSVQIKFQRFYDNLDLLEINVKRTPFGTLRKPPPKQARKVESTTKSVPVELHKFTSERVANLHESMGRQQESQPSNQSEGKRLGVMSVEYKVAMEVSSNLEKHRKSRPSNLPGLPTFLPGRTDAPRLQTQTERLLTPGEMALKEGISTNLYDHERSKRGPVKAIEKPPRRVKSPPLSKLSRERFLPEAQRLRENESWSQLRIGRPVTPPASEYTAVQSPSFVTTARPWTAMTARSGGSKNADKSKQAKQEQTDGPSNQQEEPVVGKLAAENSHQAQEVNESNNARTTDKVSENDQSNLEEEVQEKSDCSANESVYLESTGQSPEEQDKTSTPLSSTSLVVTVPGDEGAQEVDPVANSEGGVEVTSANDHGDGTKGDDAITNKENTILVDPDGGKQQGSDENDG